MAHCYWKAAADKSRFRIVVLFLISLLLLDHQKNDSTTRGALATTTTSSSSSSLSMQGDKYDTSSLIDVCEQSVILNHQHNNNNKKGNKDGTGAAYFLVGSSHNLTAPVPTEELVSFVFYRSLNDDIEMKNVNVSKVCNNDTILQIAQEQILSYHRKKNLDTTSSSTIYHNNKNETIPLAQSSFFRVFLDHRWDTQRRNRNTRRTRTLRTRTTMTQQTRRTEISVVETRPHYFVYTTHFAGQNGTVALSLQVDLERQSRRQDNSSTARSLRLDQIGSTKDCLPSYDEEPDLDQMRTTRFRYQVVIRLGVRVVASNLSIASEAQQQQQCDYANGRGEWIFHVPTSSTSSRRRPQRQLLDDIAAAPWRYISNGGRYRLFGCQESAWEADFEQGKLLLERQNACSMGDSSFNRLEPVFERFLPNFYNQVYFLYYKQKTKNPWIFFGPTSGSNYSHHGRNGPTCQRFHQTDVLILNHGSHCDGTKPSVAETAYNHANEVLKKQAKCILGIDEFTPFSKYCPDRFKGDLERLRRNVWRVVAKNRMGRRQFKNAGFGVGALDPMSISIADLVMEDGDCVHHSGPFEEEAVRFMIALAGRHCGGIITSIE